MVDWDRVEELRSKGWDWDRIADDSKVGFHPDASVREPGRALRGLYHRQRSRERRQGTASAPSPKKVAEEKERRWTLTRVGYLLTPIFAIWFVIAYLIPSPVGLVLPAIPYLALGLTVAAFVLLFGLWRSKAERWSKLLRTTVVTGVVLGLVISGAFAGLAGGLQMVGVTHQLFDGFSDQFGFTAIVVALLARNNPWAVIPSGLLFAALDSGAQAMQMSAGIPVELSFVIQGLIVFFVAADRLLDVARRKNWLARLRGPRVPAPGVKEVG